MSSSIRPQEGDYHNYYDTYISKVPDGSIFNLLSDSFPKTLHFLQSIPAEKWDYRYAPGKWNIKEVILHISDTERIFAYRLLRIARNDQTPLPGFDQNDYVPFYQTEGRSIESLIEEYQSVRKATLNLLEHLDEEALSRRGTASDSPVTALALGFMIYGHEIHHFNILNERYLND